MPGGGLMGVEELRALSLFDGLTNEQLSRLIDSGTEIRFEPGLVLFREGDRAELWWLLLDGAIDLVRHVGREEIVGAG